MIGLGLVAACVWAVSAVPGVPAVRAADRGLRPRPRLLRAPRCYAVRIWQDRRSAGDRGVQTSLHKKLTGAMLLVMTLDSVGYLIAVRFVDSAKPGLIAALEDIFVAVS